MRIEEASHRGAPASANVDGRAFQRRSSGAAVRLAAWLPIGLLVVGALVRDVRPVVCLVLIGAFAAGFARTRRTGSRPPVLLGIAGAVPIAVNFWWGVVPNPDVAGGAQCTDPLSPYATWRLAEAGLVLAAAGVLAATMRLGRHSLGLTQPSARAGAVAVTGFLIAGPLALLLGPALARPFFGDIRLAVGTLGAIPPALLFAVSNGTMEELAYRGALLRWSAPSLGMGGALLAQAAVFAFQHGGSDFVGSPLPVIAAMFGGALIAGVVALRTNSLAIPIALHVACDIPLYYYWACPPA